MTQDAPANINALRSHSIFSCSDKVAPTTGRSRSLLQIHGDEIFLACGRKIRYGSLRRLDDYVELRGVDVDFDIDSIVLNASRSILLVCGRQKVIAVIIPHASLLTKGTAVRSYVVGEALHQRYAVAQVKFHPLSSSSDCAVVLTYDSFLRIYDLSTSFDTPDTTVDLLHPTVRQQLNRGGVGDFDASQPVAFAFGAGGHGWSTFAIFVLTGDGDVFVVTPILPHSVTIDIGALARFEQYAVQGSVTTAAIHAKICSAIDQGTRTSTGISFRAPTRLSAPVVLGPLLFDPVPLEFSKRSAEPTDLLLVPGALADILVVASDDKLDIALIVDDIVLKPGAAVSCAVIESISVDKAGAIRLERTSKDARCLAIHSHGVHELSLQSSTGSTLAEDGIEDALPHSNVKLLLDCEGSSISGSLLIDSDLDLYLVSLLNDYEPHVTLVRENEVLSGLAELTLPAASTADEDAGTDAPRYKSLITRPLYKPQLATRGALPVVPAAMAKQNITVTAESLRMLGKVAVQLREDMENLHRSIVAMHRRLELQASEVGRQWTKCKALASQLDKLSGDGDTHDRVEQARARQADLEKRSAKLLSDLMRDASPKLTAAEARYFEELQRVQKRLQGGKGLVARADAVEKQYRDIKPLLQKQRQEQSQATGGEQDADSQSPMRSSQLAKLNAQLAVVEDTISRARSRCDRLAKAAAIDL